MRCPSLNKVLHLFADATASGLLFVRVAFGGSAGDETQGVVYVLVACLVFGNAIGVPVAQDTLVVS